MEEVDGFVQEGRRGIYRPAGSVSWNEAVSLIRAAIALARRNQIRELVVDTTALIGFPTPEIWQRYWAVAAWADESQATVCLVIVARLEMIDPKKFGVTVAANRGLEGNIFTTEQEAYAWLDARGSR